MRTHTSLKRITIEDYQDRNKPCYSKSFEHTLDYNFWHTHQLRIPLPQACDYPSTFDDKCNPRNGAQVQHASTLSTLTDQGFDLIPCLD